MSPLHPLPYLLLLLLLLPFMCCPAMVLFPLKALGEEGWKIAAALTARHIGGAVNYMVRGKGVGWVEGTLLKFGIIFDSHSNSSVLGSTTAA